MTLSNTERWVGALKLFPGKELRGPSEQGNGTGNVASTLVSPKSHPKPNFFSSDFFLI